MPPESGKPEILIYAHHRAEDIRSRRLRGLAQAAAPICLAAAAPGSPLTQLGEVEVNLVSDEEIARVHADFLGDPEPTDVITFDHGELFVSLDTAVDCAAEFGHSPERETLLYVIHGLLHLAGYSDKEEEARTRMHRLQEEILFRVWPLPAEG